MRLLLCGDVVGRAGRAVVAEQLPKLKEKLALDFIVVNGENAASGFGITLKIAKGFKTAGADVVTCGDHVFDQKEMHTHITTEPYLLRPGNLSADLPGVGARLYRTRAGKRVVVVHMLAQLFMKLSPDCPFAYVDRVLEPYTLGENVDAIIVDFHGEATSERMAMGHYLDGKVSLVTGTHTHVPTADAQLLPGGTAYQTDAGMCGDYNSVIGFKKEVSVQSFVQKFRGDKLTPALEDATLCATYVETDDTTGLATRIAMVRVGGRLQPSLP